MSHVDALEATLDRLTDDLAELTAIARIIVGRWRLGYDASVAVAALGAVLERLDAGNGEGAE